MRTLLLVMMLACLMVLPSSAFAADSTATARETWSKLSEAQRAELRGKLQSFKAMDRADRNRVLKRYNRFLELSEGRRAFTQLPVREREGIRENFRRYKQFSPERREQMRRMHERLSNMSPEERRRFRDKMRRWKRLSPEQRRELRERAGGGGQR